MYTFSSSKSLLSAVKCALCEGKGREKKRHAGTVSERIQFTVVTARPCALCRREEVARILYCIGAELCQDILRAAPEACGATWNLCTYVGFRVGRSKTTEILD
jgi:hypothetical protein